MPWCGRGSRATSRRRASIRRWACTTDLVENAFNLADDVIEPFRPLVDLAVVRRLEVRDEKDGLELTVEDRRALAAVLSLDTRLGEETLAMVHAIERVCDGLLAAMSRRDPALLPVPAPAG